MSENKINLVVPKDYNGTPIEVVLREGEAPVALDPKEPERVNITGTIDAPFRWLEKRVELINQKSTNIIVNRDKMCLALTIDETNYYQTVIGGVLQASKEMLEFGINTDKKWEPIKLSQFFKMHRAFFKDKSQNMVLVSTLKNFKAKVNQDIERSKEENGSKTDNYSQVVDSNLPKSFKLNIPLFKGFTCEEIEVEIYADVDGREVSLSLVSAGANEAIEEYKNKVIDEQIEAIKGVAPDIGESLLSLCKPSVSHRMLCKTSFPAKASVRRIWIVRILHHRRISRHIVVHSRIYADGIRLSINRVCKIHETDLICTELHIHICNRTISVLCYDDLCSSYIISILRQALIVESMDKDHHIGILLD